MPRDKSSRRRRHSRPNNSRASRRANEQLEGSSSSSENEAPVPAKSSSTIPFGKNRTLSGSSIRSSRRPSKTISDESPDEVQPEVATYSKYESSSSKNKIESPIDSVRKVEEYLMSDYTKSTAKREVVSSDDDLGKREKRRKSRRERKEKHRLLEANRTEDDDAYDEEGRSSERDLSRLTSKKDRADGSRKSKRRKRTRSRRDSSVKAEKQENELPITEILRKAQETTSTRYEEPVPLTELTTDTIYVQGRNGFSAMKISGDRSTGFLGRKKSMSRESTLYPIKVAILAQKIWNSTGLIHQGLLAGMALMHFLLIQTFFKLSFDVIVKYSLISELYTNIFSYLVTMCVVSAFDKFDVAHVDLEHLREIYVDHSRSFVAVPLYIATFCLHQTSLLVDDKISLLRYEGNTTEYQNNSTGFTVEEDLVTWQRITLAKDGLAVFAWLFVALGPREDMLLTHLKSMKKYADVADSSK